jgi:hypothetical protein
MYQYIDFNEKYLIFPARSVELGCPIRSVPQMRDKAALTSAALSPLVTGQKYCGWRTLSIIHTRPLVVCTPWQLMFD